MHDRLSLLGSTAPRSAAAKQLRQPQSDRTQRPDLQKVATSGSVASMGGTPRGQIQHRWTCDGMERREGVRAGQGRSFGEFGRRQKRDADEEREGNVIFADVWLVLW